MKIHPCNTYRLILASESEDKGHSIVETLIYALFILSAVASIVIAVAQPVLVPTRVAVHDCQSERCA